MAKKATAGHMALGSAERSDNIRSHESYRSNTGQ